MDTGETNWANNLIVPVAIWGSSQIRHKIACSAISPNFRHAVTGSWDGSIVIWSLDTDLPSLAPRWIVANHTASVSTICCFEDFFVACFLDGTISHHQLPIGRAVHTTVDHNYIHTNTRALPNQLIICSGFYPDLFILDAHTLHITIFLQSRQQADWVACTRFFHKDESVQIQGITVSGVLKTWSLIETCDGVCLESSFMPLGVKHAKAMSFHMENRWLLLVTTSQVLVFDVGIHVICKHTTGRHLEGGDFAGDKVVFWTKNGDLFQCDVRTKSIRQVLQGQSKEIYVPGNCLSLFKNDHYFVVADINGALRVWKLDIGDNVLPHCFLTADASITSKMSKGLIDDAGFTVVCSVHVTHLNKFAAGCSDGNILVFSATDLILAHFFQKPQADFVTLSGHTGAVRCLLYPHTEDANYPESLLISGGDDFSVSLWDILKRNLIHRFCVHSGPVVRLLTPPPDCSPRVANTICSVSVDHSVAILSIRDRKCAFLASQHPFPIVAVRWKPCHDFLVVKCFDGSVFVWEVRTGVLDRVVCGVAAEEVVYRCDQESDEVLWDFYTAGPTADELPRQPLHVTIPKDKSPVRISGVLSSPHVEAFVLLFNINRLCSYLQAIFPHTDSNTDYFCKLHMLTKPLDPVGIQKTILNVIDSIKQETGHFQEKMHLSVVPKGKEKPAPQRKYSSVSGTQLIPYAQLLLSLAHVWDQNQQLDEFCSQKLGLLRPKRPVSFDVASEDGSLSLRHPQNVDFERSKVDLVSNMALTKVLGRFGFSATISEVNETDWQKFIDAFNSVPFTNDLTYVEKLSCFWHTGSKTLRNIVRKVLPDLLPHDNGTEYLSKWSRYLPSASLTNLDHLQIISLVVCSLLVIDGKSQIDGCDIVSTGESLKCVVNRIGSSATVVGTAIDLIGRGYQIWGPFISVDDAIVSILDRCSEITNPHIILTSRATLVAIARDKPNQFIAFLKFLCKTGNERLERSKPEILSLIKELVVDSRQMFIPLLSDIVEILVTCIDGSHLKDAELNVLLGVWLPQVHHNVNGQRIAVGMPDGKIVIHELRSRRSHVFPAHDCSISAVRFSPDGKNLLAMCTAGSASLWSLSHGIFDLGVGQFKLKKLRSFPTVLTVSPNVIGININWIDNKSIMVEAITDLPSPSIVVTLSI